MPEERLKQLEDKSKSVEQRIISLVITLLLGIVGWYLNGINSSIKEMNTSLSSLNIQYTILASKQEVAEKAQLKVESDYKSLILRLTSLERWQNKVDEVLSRHETMINDKRCYVGCVDEK